MGADGQTEPRAPALAGVACWTSSTHLGYESHTTVRCPGDRADGKTPPISRLGEPLPFNDVQSLRSGTALRGNHKASQASERTGNTCRCDCTWAGKAIDLSDWVG